MAWSGKARRATAVAGLVAVLCVGCGDGGNGGGGGGGEFSNAEAKEWLTRYVREVKSWAREWKRANSTAKGLDFARVGRIVKRLGRDADRARGNFGNVPTNLHYGDGLYDRLIDAANAAGQWALIYKTNPPPYAQSPSGLRASQRVADASLDFGRKVNLITRFLYAHRGDSYIE